jgi:peptide/nickel transport system permease protein
MLRLILNRVAIAIPVLFIMTVLTYFLVSLIPGDAATVILGNAATPEKIAALNKALGLDQPFWVQYGRWLGDAVKGDLGTGIFSGDPVTKTLQQRMLPTLMLGLLATLFATIFGVAGGMWAAVRKGAIARAVDTVAMFGISLPNYWIALVLVVVVAGSWHWFPAIGYADPLQDFGGWVSHMVLPVAALAVAGVAIVAKQTHDSVSEALSRDFMRFMQANGIPRARLILRHGLRYAAVPVVSAIAGCFVNLFGGTVALETVFAIPGLGQSVDVATRTHDISVIQGAVLGYTVVILVVLVLSDVLYGLLNPKVRAAR